MTKWRPILLMLAAVAVMAAGKKAADPTASAPARQALELYDLGRYSEAIDGLTACAKGGDADCAYRLAVIFADGIVTTRDYGAAARYLKLAAAAGHAKAQFELGTLADDGHGMEKNRAEAAKWYRESAARGVKEAQFNLAVMLETGEGVKADPVEAFMWYYLSVANGFDTLGTPALNTLTPALKPAEIRQALDRAQAFKPNLTPPGKIRP